MLWRHASFEPQRCMPCGEAAMPVSAKGNDGAAVSHRFDRDMGGCRC
jgi:hypothetical protein